MTDEREYQNEPKTMAEETQRPTLMERVCTHCDRRFVATYEVMSCLPCRELRSALPPFKAPRVTVIEAVPELSK